MRVLLPVDRRRIKESDSSSEAVEFGDCIAHDCEGNSIETGVTASGIPAADLELPGEVQVALSDSFQSPSQGELSDFFKRDVDCKTTAARLACGEINEEATYQGLSKSTSSTSTFTSNLYPEFRSTASEEILSSPASGKLHKSDPDVQTCLSLQSETLHIQASCNKRTLEGTRKAIDKRALPGTDTASFAALSPVQTIENIHPQACEQLQTLVSSTDPSLRLALLGQSKKQASGATCFAFKSEGDHTDCFVDSGSSAASPLTPVVPAIARASGTKSSKKLCTMAVGGRFPRNDDDEDSSTSTRGTNELRGAARWSHPVENEPPTLQNHRIAPFSVEIVNDSDVLDPASDDERELAESSPGHVEANASKKFASYKNALAGTQRDDDLHLQRFNEALKKQGLELVEQEGDGNCLFRAVSLQVYGSADSHAEVRERCMDWMARNEEHYSNFVAVGSSETDADAIPVARAASAFQDYVARKRIIGVHGNHAEIQAISELFNRPIEVYTPPVVDEENAAQPNSSPLLPMNFHAEYKTNDPPIRLSFHDGNHYNAIIDPLVPTAGLGLGLPGLKPGLADQLQVTKAKTESDQIADEVELQRILKESHDEKDDELQRVLKETSMDYSFHQKAMALTDVEATNYELEQKALANSMESYFRQEHDRKQKATAPACVLSSGRRRRGSPPPAAHDEPSYSSFASLPAANAATARTGTPIPAVASLASAAASVDDSGAFASSSLSGSDEEYPQTVQELVMNGFELEKVIRAYEFIGDHFDDLLSFLLSSSTTS